MTAKMRYREQRFECGDHLEVNVFPVFGQLTGTSRRAKRKPTKEVQEKLNQHNREKEVNRVICANFTDDDLYITLTFKQSPADADEANKIFRLFIDKINRRRSKRNLSKVKYVKTVEVGARTGRIHLHLVMSGNGLTAKDISEVWGRGYVDVKPLQFDSEGCMGLSKYFVKEKRQAGKNRGQVHAVGRVRETVSALSPRMPITSTPNERSRKWCRSTLQKMSSKRNTLITLWQGATSFTVTRQGYIISMPDCVRKQQS